MATTKVTLPVKGMDCASCANIVTKAIKKTPGVISAKVNLATEKADIEYNSDEVNLNKINQNVIFYGYSLNLESNKEVTEQKESPLDRLKGQVEFLFPISLAVFALMLYDAYSQYFTQAPPFPIPMPVFNFILFILSSITLFIFGQEFLKAIPRFIKTKTANMDTLIGLGSTVAFVYSSIVFLLPNIVTNLNLPENTYFDVVIVVIGFIKLGKFLEANSKQKTGEAIKKLLELSAKTALVERKGEEIQIDISEVIVGDIIIVKPGTKIPVDGKIIEGSTSIDESTITGESLPVDKSVGDIVTSGTINKQGYLKFIAEKVGSDTMLSQIIKMVENAQGSKAPIEALADKVSAIFVPAVLVLSIVTFFVWLLLGNLSLAITSLVGILVIACPCALGLATPTAIIVAVGKGAQNGILIKDASVLEKLHSVDTIVFDKTGTITNGKPEVTNILTTSSHSEDEILSFVASLEKQSEHPIAQAIENEAKASGTKTHKIESFKNLEGKGVSGKIKSKTYYAGNSTLLKDLKIKLENDSLTAYTKQGKTPVFLSDGKSILGTIFISDTIKDSSIKAISKLHSMGLKTVMLTGDDQNTANFIASQVGIDEVIAKVLPNEKAEKIIALQQSGKKVAMVGDGINDAPALAQAEVGIAMSTGTDIAIESAGVTLLHGDLSKVAQTINLSKSTIKTIRQNLFWAFFYNVITIPVAAGILYPIFGIVLNPAIAGAAMAFSSVSVVTNSLRLKAKKL